MSHTKCKRTEGKASLLQEVRDCCDQYEHVFVFSVENMRNNKLKDVRAHWKTSRCGYCTAVFLIISNSKPLPLISQSVTRPHPPQAVGRGLVNCKGWFASFCFLLQTKYQMIGRAYATQEYVCDAGIKLFLFLHRNTCPNYFICTSSRKVTQAKGCKLALIKQLCFDTYQVRLKVE